MARTATIAEKIPVTEGSSSSGVADASRLTHTETLYAVVSVNDNTTTVYNGPCLLFGVYVNTALSAEAVPIQDNSTTVVSIPASSAAGVSIPYPGIRFETSLIVNPNDASTGSITVAYRPI